MPNPYHDSEGKFASRDELAARVQNARDSGDFETYFRERTNLEAIEKIISTNETNKTEKSKIKPQKSLRNPLEPLYVSEKDFESLDKNVLDYINNFSQTSGFDPENLTVDDKNKLVKLFNKAGEEGYSLGTEYDLDESSENLRVFAEEMEEKNWKKKAGELLMFSYLSDKSKDEAKKVLISNLREHYRLSYTVAKMNRIAKSI